MDIEQACLALGALSQPTRLKIFRLLVGQASTEMAAGTIAQTLGVPHNTLSSHLSKLVGAGLIRSRRVSRSVLYRVDTGGVGQLMAYLLEDCCQGRPELCAPETGCGPSVVKGDGG